MNSVMLNLLAQISLLIFILFLTAVLASMIGLGGGLVVVPLIMLVIGSNHTLSAKLIYVFL